MSDRSDASMAALLLTQRLLDLDAAPLKASEYWRLLDTVEDPGALLGASAEEIAAVVGDAGLAERIAARLEAATSFAFALDDAQQSGIRLVASVDADYPAVLRDRLGAGAPPLLHVVGDPRLLHGALLGILGSRSIDEAGAEVAKEAARLAVKDGLGIVSGAAKGVDQLAMAAGLDAGGVVCGVVADSLVRATKDPEIRRAVGDGLACLCSPYKPTAGFSAANAMGRNKIIYALSEATQVVATDVDKGGTWAGATEALRQRIAPVLVWTGDGAASGNAALVEKGAMPVASLDGLLPPPQPEQREDEATQLGLGL